MKIIGKKALQAFGIFPKQCVIILVLHFLVATSFQSLYAQANNLTIKPVNPPYIAQTSNFMALLFHLEASEAQALLPENVTAKRDDSGLATASLETYSTDQISGVPKYTIAFITIEVIGGESNYGTPGNWAIWGVMDNDTTLQSFKHFYNFPYSHERRISIENKQDEYIAIVGENRREGFELKMTKDVDKPVAAGGTATIFSQSLGDSILKTEIPWLANGNAANIVSFKVKSGSNQVLQTIQRAKPFYGQISTNVFSYTKPVTQ